MTRKAMLLVWSILFAGCAWAHAAQVTLVWMHAPTTEAPTVPSGFQVLSCQGADCPPVDLPGAATGAGVLTYVHTNIPANTMHCYQVVALNGPARSLPSNKACGGAFVLPAAPGSLTLTFTP